MQGPSESPRLWRRLRRCRLSPLEAPCDGWWHPGRVESSGGLSAWTVSKQSHSVGLLLLLVMLDQRRKIGLPAGGARGAAGHWSWWNCLGTGRTGRPGLLSSLAAAVPGLETEFYLRVAAVGRQLLPADRDGCRSAGG